ncbi:hypothetical protein C9374_009227 [Naegleria lovaniensis]|uniref:RNA-dependent RNA polymerase n=1 Tax=Naegleria lovaniensis TaxID=51637 RepID=A0AA88GIV4_NAELO|nr:uncharacterized protein C9374_009227 [Naegleria lovaniensis]KAG2377316.1 hypothetical protein C9374_009227 [Naegleria lovaniensis]
MFTEHCFRIDIDKSSILRVVIDEFVEDTCACYNIFLELKHPPQVRRKTEMDQKWQRLVAPTSEKEDIQQISSLWMCNFAACNSLLIKRCIPQCMQQYPTYEPYLVEFNTNVHDHVSLQYTVEGVGMNGIPNNRNFDALPFGIRYLLLCFNTQICGLLNCQQRVDYICHSISELIQICSNNIVMVEEVLRGILASEIIYPDDFMDKFHAWRDEHKPKETTGNSKNGYQIRKLVITPTRILFFDKSHEGGNYLLRHNPAYVESFSRVSFCDEDRHSLFPQQFANLAHRVTYFVDSYGIPLFNGRYEMLAYSSSQLRAFSYWSIYVDNETDKKGLPKTIIDKLGNFSDEECVAKRAARIGLCLTQTYEGEEVLFDKTTDIISSANSNLSDGIGRVSETYAKELARKHNIQLHGQSYIPSAFQFRLAGYKGVVVVDPNLHKQTSKELLLSKSQCKFSNSDNKSFGLVSYSRRRPADLNRQIIAVLDSNGLPEQNILHLVQENLDEIQNYAKQYHGLRKTLSKEQHAIAQNIKLSLQNEHASVILQHDPLITLAQRLGFEKSLSHLKSHIPLKRSALLMGVLDFEGVLEEDEVFIQLSPHHECEQPLYANHANCYEKGGVVEGQVIVTRSPALHPGDVRKLKAVNDGTGKLSHLKDVIVFSSKSLISQPSKMGGGDLDGDEFFVSWEPLLMDFQECEPLLDHNRLNAQLESAQMCDENYQNYLAPRQFFCEYIHNEHIGAIANAHLKLYDWSKHNGSHEGVRDKQCLQLAEIHSHQVDYAKSGKKIKYNFPNCNTPHYMTKDRHSDNTYHSKSVLGQLFDMVENFRSNNFLYLSHSSTTNSNTFNVLDLEMLKLFPNSLTFKDKLYSEIDNLYEDYVRGLKSLMKRYHIEAEHQLLFSLVNLKEKQVQCGKSWYKLSKEIPEEVRTFTNTSRQSCVDLIQQLVSNHTQISSGEKICLERPFIGW